RAAETKKARKAGPEIGLLERNSAGATGRIGDGFEFCPEKSGHVIAIHPGDEVMRNQLWAYRAALILIRTITKAGFVHRLHHRQHAFVALRLALRHETQ